MSIQTHIALFHAQLAQQLLSCHDCWPKSPTTIACSAQHLPKLMQINEAALLLTRLAGTRISAAHCAINRLQVLSWLLVLAEVRFLVWWGTAT